MRLEGSITKIIIGLVFMIIIGCSEKPSSENKPSSTIVPNERNDNLQIEKNVTKNDKSTLQKKVEEPKKEIDSDVTYSIINSNTYLDWKRSLDVRLNKKVSQNMLRNIAYKMKAQDPRNYERIFICYYLPDMKVGSGAWATTHFNPELEVKIIGLTAEQENTLRQLPEDASLDVIGSWLDDTPYLGCRINIFRKDGKIYMENTYKDGSSSIKEIIKKSSERGRKFERKEGSDVGEYYLIDNQGNLQFWDEEGIISTAKKIK